MDSYSKLRAVVKNPFSTATVQPKIPDGKANASMGARRNLVGELDFKEWGVWDILLSPRYDSPIYAASAGVTLAAPGAATGTIAKQEKYDFDDNHPFNSAWKSINVDSIIAEEGSEISKIRVVSQGTRITLTNSTDDNDGWFEVFRFHPQKDSTQYVTDEANATTGTTYKPAAVVSPDLFNNRDTNSASTFNMNLASKGNYTTGKLRNLHRYTWVHKPCSNEVEFKDLPQFLGVGEAAALDPAAYKQDNTHANTAFQDWDYDVIWIRVHGRGIEAAQTGGCCLPTKLMFHTVQNVECIYGERNTLHSYMTKSLNPYTGRNTRSMSKYKKQYTKKKTYRPRGLYQQGGKYYIDA